MMPLFIGSIVFCVAYMIGGIPAAYVAGKLKGIVITQHGSGNVGGTNAFRILGPQWGIIVAAFDILKAILIVWLSSLIDKSVTIQIVAAAGVILGHNWSPYIGFKGGKGVATSIGVGLMLYPPQMLLSLSVGIMVVVFTRYVSLGSLVFVTLLPMTIFLSGKGGLLTTFSLGLMVLAYYRHTSNIVRLSQGKESKIARKKGA